jgi:hypothetical protein
MKSLGLKIPAPWKHDFGITAFTKVQEGSGGLLEDSSKNAGFWDELFSQVNPETGKTELVGYVEAPGDPNDPSTPAGKIGTSVKDTSIYFRKDYVLTDDSGKTLSNVPMHIALVTHPIEPNQSNFEPQDGADYYIAMSELVVDTDLGELAKLLQNVAGVYIPSNTTADTLAINLTIALNQKALSMKETDEDGDGKSSNPSNNHFETEPLIMSKLDQTQIDVLLATKAVNPTTGKPFTKEDLQGDLPEPTPSIPAKDDKNELIMSAMQNAMQDDRRKTYRSRINALVESNRADKAFADDQLYPMADNYSLRFESGNIVKPEIEVLIMSLEAMPMRQPAAPPVDLSEFQAHYLQDGNSLSDEQMDKIADALLNDDEFINV